MRKSVLLAPLLLLAAYPAAAQNYDADTWLNILNGQSVRPQPSVAIPPGKNAAGWPDGTVAQDMRRSGSVEIEVSGLSGGDTIIVSRTLIFGGAPKPQAYVDGIFNTGTTISADGTYSFSGGAFVTYARTGSASTPAITIRGF